MRRMYSEKQLKDVIKEEVEGGTLSNAKPIYCHPITIEFTSESESGTNVYLALLIFDNSNTEYNSYSKLMAKLNSIWDINVNAVFPITGAVYYQKTTIYVAQKIGIRNGTKSILAVNTSTGTLGYFTIGDYVASATVYDGVNKIN